MTEFVLLLIVVVFVTVVCLSLFLIFRTLRERRLAYWRQRLPPVEQEFSLVDPRMRPNANQPWPDKLDRAFDDMIVRTGLGWTPQQALGWILFTGVSLASVLMLWQDRLWLMTAGLLAGMAVPLLIYLFLQARWRTQIQNQLPDTLYLLARSLRAGLSLEQALENVAQHGSAPLAQEFRRSVEQIKLGLTAPTALNSLARRILLPDFDVFVTVVALNRSIGGNLTLLLDRVAQGTRDRNLFRGHVRTATALSRITAFALASGAPLIFLGYAMWQPEFVTRFTESATGIRALVSAAVLEIVGIVWVSILLRHRY